MFTGLIQATGAILSADPLEQGVRIAVDARGLAPRRIHVGDSIAVNGVCLTVTSCAAGVFTAEVSRETLSKTCGLDRPGPVNLESSLAVGDALGGHLVAGHVDGVGTVLRCVPVGESVELVVRVPAPLAPLMAVKGSVSIQGVSLTVNQVRDVPQGCEVSINLIAHTLSATTLGALVAGAPVNVEADLIARYVARYAARLYGGDGGGENP